MNEKKYMSFKKAEKKLPFKFIKFSDFMKNLVGAKTGEEASMVISRLLGETTTLLTLVKARFSPENGKFFGNVMSKIFDEMRKCFETEINIGDYDKIVLENLEKNLNALSQKKSVEKRKININKMKES